MSESQTEPAKSESSAPPKRPNILRRLYNWVLSWADSRYGTAALFGISFSESSFFPIPPDVLQVALSVARPRRAFFYAGVSAAASILGGILGYFIGYAIWDLCSQFFYDYVPGFTHEHFNRVGELYKANAFVAIFSAAFTPIPFKVFTIAAGVFHDYVPLHILVVASALGRSMRFFAVATVIYFFGQQAKDILEKYFEWLTLAFCVLLVGGFIVVKLMID